jgi:hypothetical protein
MHAVNKINISSYIKIIYEKRALNIQLNCEKSKFFFSPLRWGTRQKSLFPIHYIQHHSRIQSSTKKTKVRIKCLKYWKGRSVKKNAAHKESLWETSHVQEQGLMASPTCQAGQGKMVQHRLCTRHGFYRRGRFRKLGYARLQ